MALTFLEIFSWVAFLSTVALFFTGIPICYKIWKRKSTEDFTSVPFVMGVISASFWLRYGFLKSEPTVVKVNVFALTLNTIYLILFYVYTKKKFSINLTILGVIALDTVMLTFIRFSTSTYKSDVLGVCCSLFNIICFGSPLAGLRTVFRQGHCETLPLPMSIGNFVVSSEWLLYGILINDIYIITPNSLGVCLAVIQLSFFIVFPLKADKEAILKKLCKSSSSKEENKSKTWIPETISRDDLNIENDLKNSAVSKDKKRNNEVIIDTTSLNGSDITEYTDVSQSITEKPQNISVLVE